MAVKQRLDTPTNNFATWNPLHSKTYMNLSQGNLHAVPSSLEDDNVHQHTIATQMLVDGYKWYWEVYIVNESTDSTTVGVLDKGQQISVDKSANDQNRQLLQVNGYPAIGAECRGGIGVKQDADVEIDPTGTDSGTANINFDSESNGAYDGNKPWNSNTGTNVNSNTTPVIGVLLDLTGTSFGTFSYTLDGTNYSTAYTKVKLNRGWVPAISGYHGGAADEFIGNFGQDPTFNGNKTPAGTYTDEEGIGLFFHDPPAGALALCASNLPDSTSTVFGDTPEDYFDAFIYNASGSSLQQFAHGFSFTPDLLWIKNRSSSAGSHWIYDRVRGFTVYDLTTGKGLTPESTAVEGGDVTLGPIIEPSTVTPTPPTHTISTHITIRDGNSSGIDDYNVNHSGHNYVVWGWKAGGNVEATDTGTGVAGSAKLVNTNGIQADTTCLALTNAISASDKICPKRMSINQVSGFSIVKYTGNGANNTDNLVPHGLTKTLDLVIVKNLTSIGRWQMLHKDSPDSATYTKENILLNDISSGSDDFSDQIKSFNNQYFVLRSDDTTIAHTNDSGDDYIAYCWHAVPGYSAFGIYTGNADVDGPVIYTGFRPAFLLLTSLAASRDWLLYDSIRGGSSNPFTEGPLQPNSSGAPYGSTYITGVEFLSNGFKIKENLNNINGAEKHIYMAFAEQDGKYSNAR